MDNIRTSHALKPDAYHAFNDLIDNFARYAQKFNIKGGDGLPRCLYQIEGSLKWEKLLMAISGVYADFGYPVDMASFIYYMPPSNPVDIEHLNPDQAGERLVVKLGTFLIKERLAIESGCDFLPKKIY